MNYPKTSRKTLCKMTSVTHRVDLLGADNLEVGVVELLAPMSQVAGHPRDRKEHREEL